MKKIPLRMCTGCGEMKAKKELVRVVRSKEGEISLDLTGKKSGRGAMKPFCINESCPNFLPEEKRGYRRKPAASVEAAEAEADAEAAKAAEAPKKTAAKKPAAKKAAAKKPAAQKTTAKKTAAKKPAAKKTAAKKKTTEA